VGDYDGNFYAVDLIKKKIEWTYTLPSGSPFLSSPAVHKDKVVIGSQDKTVYCFDRTTGKLNWQYQTQSKIESSPVIMDDLAIVCSNDGFIRFISTETGKLNYEYNLGIAVKSTPAIIDNLLVVGGNDGKIYTFTGSK
jgi:outer membrane protein assembly factor BamB